MLKYTSRYVKILDALEEKYLDLGLISWRLNSRLKALENGIRNKFQ